VGIKDTVMTEIEVEQYIRKAFTAGIPAEQISNDLLAKGVDKTTIDMAMATVNTNAASAGSPASVGSILISIGFIIYGIIKLSANTQGVQHVFGYIFIVLGIIGLVAKVMSRK